MVRRDGRRRVRPGWRGARILVFTPAQTLFKDLSELRKAGLTLAVIKFGFLVDHFVTVLEVTDAEVVVGDPLTGLERMSYDQFRQKWRFVGVVVRLRS